MGIATSTQAGDAGIVTVNQRAEEKLLESSLLQQLQELQLSTPVKSQQHADIWKDMQALQAHMDGADEFSNEIQGLMAAYKEQLVAVAQEVVHKQARVNELLDKCRNAAEIAVRRSNKSADHMTRLATMMTQVRNLPEKLHTITHDTAEFHDQLKELAEKADRLARTTPDPPL